MKEIWKERLDLVLMLVLIFLYGEYQRKRECELTGKRCYNYSGWGEIAKRLIELDQEFLIYWETSAQLYPYDEYIQGNLTEWYVKLGHTKCCTLPGSCTPITRYPFGDEQAPNTDSDSDLGWCDLLPA